MNINEFTEIIDKKFADIAEFNAKSQEKLDLAIKAANFSETATNKAAVEGAKELSVTGQILNALGKGDRTAASEISKKHWGVEYYKAMNTTAESAIMPTSFSSDVYKRMSDYSVIRRNSRVKTMTANTMSENELTATVSAGKVAELSAITSSKNTYVARNIVAEAYWGSSIWSRQIEIGNELDLLNELKNDFARALARAEQFSLLNSAVSGSEGIMTATGTSVYVLGGGTTSGRDTFLEAGADDVEKAFAALRQLNVGTSSFKLYISADIAAAISSKVVANVGYQEMMKIQYRDGRLYSIAGLPIEEVTGDYASTNMLPTLADTAVTTDFAFISDLSNTLLIGDRPGIEIDVLTSGSAVDEAAATINLNMTGAKQMRAFKFTGQRVIKAGEIMKLRTSTT